MLLKYVFKFLLLFLVIGLIKIDLYLILPVCYQSVL